MSDRELLEKAAKAAGYADAEWQDMEGWGEVRYGFSEAIWSALRHAETGSGYWNPLVSDAHALRLAVKLRLDLTHYESGACGVSVTTDDDPFGLELAEELAGDNACDPYAATRRAIVRAAAALEEKR